MSSRNATSHGLTSRDALLPSEDPAEFAAYIDDYRAIFRPRDLHAEELAAELAGIRWRLRRVPVFEAQILNIEIRGLQSAAGDADERAKGLNPSQLAALAFIRLCERKVMQNLFNQEARLNRRAEKIEARLIERADTVKPQAPRAPAPPPQQPVEKRIIPEPTAFRKNEPTRVEPTPGRNASCPCGSGIKFKRCCLNAPPFNPAVAAAA